MAPYGRRYQLHTPLAAGAAGAAVVALLVASSPYTNGMAISGPSIEPMG